MCYTDDIKNENKIPLETVNLKNDNYAGPKGIVNINVSVKYTYV